MIREEEIIIIGKFQKTHALKGELNMISDIDPEYFTEGHPLILNYDGILVPYYIETIRPKGSTSFLVKLKGVNNEEEASFFVNKEIGILKKDAESWLDTDLLDSNQLQGFKIINEDKKEEIGIIDSVDSSTANLLFIVKQKNGEEILLPANEDLITEIDLENKLITMILPEGIIGLNKKE